ncbi:hypothetical protein D3C81_1224910 [compost metagenome]
MRGPLLLVGSGDFDQYPSRLAAMRVLQATDQGRQRVAVLAGQRMPGNLGRQWRGVRHGGIGCVPDQQDGHVKPSWNALRRGDATMRAGRVKPPCRVEAARVKNA